MKLKLFFLLLFTFSACGLQRVESQQVIQSSGSQPVKSASKIPVLVELYTSEGCSSCPPADRALAALQKDQPLPNVEIVTLAFHVDYWNHLGWTDRFSSPLFSQRQEFYSRRFKGSTYTPQMVVDGSVGFVGGDIEKTRRFVTEATKTEKAKIELQKDADVLRVKIYAVPKHENATIYLAIAEDNLASNVKKGENSGVKMEHMSVVRELRLVGSLPATVQNFANETSLQLKPDWKKENLKLVVFIQEIQSRKVIGVDSLTMN